MVAPHKALTCGLLDEAEDLFLSTTAADGTVANHFAILDRQLVPKFTRDGRPDRSITHARVACGQMGDNLACLKPDVLRGLLGDYYPCECLCLCVCRACACVVDVAASCWRAVAFGSSHSLSFPSPQKQR